MNSNQYLRPEDLPITDAKKSPLALLAMTCSNIGADLLGTGKPMSLGSYKNSKKQLRVDSDQNESSRPDSASSDKTQAKSIDTNRSSSTNSYSAVSEHSNSDNARQITSVTSSATTNVTSSANNCKISFKPYESVPCKNSSSNINGSSNNNTTSGASDMRRPPSNSSNSDVMTTNGHGSDDKSHHHHHHHQHHKSSSSPSSKQGHHNQSRPSSGSSPKSEGSKQVTNSASGGQSEMSKNHAAASLMKQASEAAAAADAAHKNGYGHYHGHHIMSSEHEQLLKSAAHFSAAAAAAYQHQQATQQVLANMGKVGPCADPYCRGCQLALAGVPTSTPCCNGLSSCPPSHVSMAGHHGLHSPYSALGGHPSPFGSRFPSLGGQAGLQGPGRPFTCSWTAGGAYCGKNFNSSEELLQHLKSHTSFSPGLSAMGQYPHLDPMLTSPVAGLRRTAFDPVNRYHPYKSFSGNPLNPLQSVLNQGGHHGQGGPMNPHAMASLGLHYPPAAYGPYAGRLGAPIPP